MLFLLLACSDYQIMSEKTPVESSEEISEEGFTDEGVPVLSVQPNPIDFGYGLVYCPAKEENVRISNIGDATLSVSEVKFMGDDTEIFTRTFSPVELEPNEYTDITLSFIPMEDRQYESRLFVQSNDMVTDPITPVYARGAAGSLYEQSFQQQHNEKVDVLWVVDNSPSMKPIIANVRNNFSVFVDEFVDLGLDYHMAVITTDMDDLNQSGKIQGDIFTSQMLPTTVISDFLVTIDQGVEGSIFEEAFDASHAALTAPLLNTHNAGFFREQVNNVEPALSIIVLSDENDISDMAYEDYKAWLLSMKTDPELVQFHSVVTVDPDTCYADVPDSHLGTDYINLSRETNGYVADICTDQMQDMLLALSSAVAGLKTSISLDYTPSASYTIEVRVDGLLLSQDEANGWKYDEESNSILFMGEGIPPQGASVAITYQVDGSCE